VVAQLEAGEKLLLIIFFALHDSRYESKKLDSNCLHMFINSCATGTKPIRNAGFLLNVSSVHLMKSANTLIWYLK
jgi:hypothetical protein